MNCIMATVRQILLAFFSISCIVIFLGVCASAYFKSLFFSRFEICLFIGLTIDALACLICLAKSLGLMKGTIANPISLFFYLLYCAFSLEVFTRGGDGRILIEFLNRVFCFGLLILVYYTLQVFLPEFVKRLVRWKRG